MTRQVDALSSSDGPLCRSFDLLMLDLDGVVYVGQHAVDGAGSALRAARDAGVALAYVTNNASRTPYDIAEHLRGLDMPIARDDDVVTSAQAAAHIVANMVPAGSEVLVVGGAGLMAALDERGLTGVDTWGSDTAAVVQGFHPDLGWKQLAEGSYAIQTGLPWVASNLDLTVPTQRGVAPGNGSLVQAVVNATGRRPIVAGKPNAALFNETIERVGGDRPLVVGDRLDTDIEGANAVGAESLAVLTGITDIQEIADAPAHRRPTFIAKDLSGLHVPHPPVETNRDNATCGEATAVIASGYVVSQTSEADELHFIRAATSLAWAHHTATGEHLEVGRYRADASKSARIRT